jgi:ribosomal protein S18 acetylase RimI-like enzyme
MRYSLASLLASLFSLNTTSFTIQMPSVTRNKSGASRQSPRRIEASVAKIDESSKTSPDSKDTKNLPETSLVKDSNNPTFRRRSARGKKRSNNARLKGSRSVARSAIPLTDPEVLSSSEQASLESNKRTRSRDRNYRIRAMEMKDCAVVYQLGNSIFTASEFPNLYRTWDDFAVIANFANSAEFCYVVIGEKRVKHNNDGDDNENDNDQDEDQDEEIIGFLLGDSITKTSLGTRGYIQWVAVAPPYRRLGIATQLLNQFCAVAEAENISLLLG